MATYDFTPANGGANAVGTLESVAQLAMYKITIKNDSNTAIDLRANDAAHGSAYDLILREVQPLMAFAPDGSTGVIHAVVDGHAVDAATLQSRLRTLVVGLGLGTTVAGNDTTVEAAASFVITP